jgi:hypothetical protein
MVGVPYASLGLVSFLIYRGCKKNEAFRSAARDSRPEPTRGDG